LLLPSIFGDFMMNLSLRLNLNLANLVTIGFCSLIGTYASPVYGASITNGSFDSTLNGWTIIAQPGAFGNWFQTAGSVSQLGNQSILAPSQGDGYAHTAQTGATSQVLFQDIVLEANTQHRLSFDWFTQDWSSFFKDAQSLDKDVFPNQHFRVDLVQSSFTDWFGDNSSAGVLANLIAPVGDSAPAASWKTLSADLTPWAGKTVRLAFRQVDNQGFFNAGVDAVKVTSTPIQTTPESSPSWITILVIGCSFIGFKRRSSRGTIRPIA
jgi:hypothetical protein